MYFIRSLEAKAFSRPRVKSIGNAVTSCLVEILPAIFLQYVLSDKSIGIFVGATFPGVV